jgi:hypothetical protein
VVPERAGEDSSDHREQHRCAGEHAAIGPRHSTTLGLERPVTRVRKLTHPDARPHLDKSV